MNPNTSIVDEKIHVILENNTKVTLHIKNKRKPSFGPSKGKLVIYKELKIAPGEQATFDFFKTDEHQLAIHSATGHKSETFFYTIHDYSVENGSVIILKEDNYTIKELLS